MLDRLRCLGTCSYLGGIPSVPEAFCWSWGALREFNAEFLCGQGETIHYTRATFSLHSSARNFLVSDMRGDWIWMTDTDHVMEPDVVFKMVKLQEQYQLPVLTAIYRHKALPHHPMLWVWNEQEQGFVSLVEYDKTVPCFQVDAAGGGCLLVHRTAIEKLERMCVPPEEIFDHHRKWGEDMSFFLRCRNAGIPVYATPLAETTHLMTRGITEEDYVEGWWESEQVETKAVK